jgi:hypothetical protein
LALESFSDDGIRYFTFAKLTIAEIKLTKRKKGEKEEEEKEYGTPTYTQTLIHQMIYAAC